MGGGYDLDGGAIIITDTLPNNLFDMKLVETFFVSIILMLNNKVLSFFGYI